MFVQFFILFQFFYIMGLDMNKKLKILELLEKNSLVFNNLDKLFLFLSDGLNCDVEEVKKIFYSLLSNGDIYEIRKNKFITVLFIAFSIVLFVVSAVMFSVFLLIIFFILNSSRIFYFNFF